MMYWKARTVRATGLRCLLVLLVWVGVGISGRPAQAAQDSTPPAIPFQPAPAGEALYVSFARPGNVGNIEFDTSDILVYYQKKWLMFFDGSDVGLRGQKLMAFELLADDSILMAFAPRTLTLPELTSLAEQRIVKSLNTVAGVGRAALIGGQSRQIDIRINESSLRALGVGADEVVTALRSGNQNLPAGSMAARRLFS